ncbi:ricin-type beta-trefoil lectin domain protein (plasmid) [Streptomyces sp. NBC_01717]|uniref:RICIN domain-containing protein n=1 Tax=Streptomyces sp. NBC_01717 TaxID=2975918 RepID=UPI002E3454AB|nr:RICIN domain-containing protein [Streptomyces sp. NBC_01717]
MLAAAALVGAILLGVPLLLVGEDHDNPHDSAANFPQDARMTDSSTTGGDLGNYVPQPPSTSSQPDGSPESKKHHFKKTASDGKPKTAATSPGSDSGKVRQSAPQPQRSGTAEQKKPSASNAPAADPVTQGRWATYTFSMTNRLLGRCLVKNSSSTDVAQGSCDYDNDNDKWRFNAVGDGTYLIKNEAANQCLDTNGKDMYFSGCATGDIGQRWHFLAAEGCSLVIKSKQYGDYLTAWNDRRVTLADPSTVDNPGKYKWEAPSLRRC